MIKQDFYIANLIARYLSEEITPEETIKLTTWRDKDEDDLLWARRCARAASRFLGKKPKTGLKR